MLLGLTRAETLVMLLGLTRAGALAMLLGLDAGGGLAGGVPEGESKGVGAAGLGEGE